jgi:hypothetical protein
MARWICLSDLLRGIPQIIIDGVGGLISNLLDAVMRLPPQQRREALSRLAYFDMSGKLTGHVCPLPFFYRLDDESWNDVGSRPLHTAISLDSHLRNAPIMGANQLLSVGLPTNQILAASGWQITEARLLLDKPRLFKQHLRELKAETDDWVLREACDWYFTYMGWDSKKRSMDTLTYRRKLDQLLRNDAAIASLGSDDWDFMRAMEQRRLTVVMEFTGLQQNPELMMNMMNSVVDRALNFVKHRVEKRGPGMHLPPIAIVIDELAMLTNFDASSGSEEDVFAKKLGEILDQFGRQGMVYFMGANQEQYQISPALYKTLMGAGIVVCGKTSDWEAAKEMANRFIPAQPNRVKRYEPIYRVDDTIRGYRQVDMSLDEQTQKTAAMFMNLGKFQFLVKEYGNPQLWLLDTTKLDPGIYPDAERVKDLKIMLSERWGTPIDDILRAIKHRHQQIAGEGKGRIKPTQLQVKTAALRDTLNQRKDDDSTQPDQRRVPVKPGGEYLG